ncbi:MAG: SusC/RagA family TonB-linked outer membrane protein [Flavobacterium sp.]|uniref:SusC/RagA family TonB-linked outer membrane protein n=1 Tax=Flavobacterium sp. TaxID=239 RepID=UPI002639C478|nr:SusC/RagA family TonB-linked outer membrane protein [Flavobacterium sp.]MDD5149868.1 SusC/RagA family TonB-linked outer membrane protein [Flavobacterium sp.]
MKFTKSLIFCIMTFLLTIVAQAQDISVSGKVIDENGLPIPGASVSIKGAPKATSTDLDGSYQIKAPKNGILIVSYIGYTSVSEAINGRTTINVNLKPQNEELKEVVVTALGVKRSTKAIGYATQTVKGETLQTVRGVDVATSLTGKVAGLLVKNSTDFAAAPEIQLRGEKDPPLLVIDGVPYGNMSLRDVPADDIESINVLKGSTASALYGVRGQVGAIMVTTKKGASKNGLEVSFNSSSMYTAGYLAIPKMQSTFGRVIDNTNTVSTSGDGAWGVPLDGRMVNQWNYVTKQWGLSPYLPVGKDNFANFISQGYIMNNNFSVVQQGENGNLRASASWVKNQGQYPNSVYDKITYSIGGEMRMDKFTLSSSLTYNKQTSPNVGFNGYTAYDPMYTLLVWSAPDYDVRTTKDYWIVKDKQQNTSYLNTNNNPYYDRYERTRSLNRDVINGTLALSYKFSPLLKATFRTGYDNFNDHQTIQIPMSSLHSAGASTVIDGGTDVWGESQLGSYNEGTSRGYSYNNDFLLEGNKSLGDFTIEGLAGATSYFKQTEGIEAFTQGGLLIPGYYSLKSSILPAKVNPYLSRIASNSLFGRLAVSWKSIAFLEGSIRNDWASTLSAATRSYSYPSLSGSLVLSELLPKTDWLSFWKIRGSWTTARNIPSPFSINSTYSLSNNVWGSLSGQSLPTSIRPTNLRSDGNETYEAGTAISFFKKRVSLDVTYYEKRYFDGITNAGISSSSGFYTALINTGEEQTRKGIEASLDVTAIKRTDWQWNLGFNWASSAIYYSKLDPIYSSNNTWVKVGERADAYVINELMKDPQGNIIYSNGLPVYAPFQTRVGYADPKFTWGLNTMLKYKNFTFNASVDGRVGGLAQTRTEMYMWISGNHPDSVVPERFLDANDPGSKNYVGTGVKVVSGDFTYDKDGILTDTRTYAPNDVKVTYESYINKLHKGTAWGGAPGPLETLSTTFFKIREMSISFDFPKDILDILHAKSLSFSAVGQNLYLKAKDFKYSDPDGGTENFSDPSQRFVGFNIKANF